jgi:diguanylate cyclase (GGDEF)-like protein
MLSVHLGETVDYAQLQGEAAAQLAQLSMQAEVDRAQSSRREHEARMESQRLNEEKRVILKAASTDGLTNIANRAAFDERLREELDRAREKGQSLGLLMMDVDRFKQLNDTYGHQAGDEVLRRLAACVRETVKNAGFAARYGGEEFVIILPNETPDAVHDLAESVRAAIASETIQHNGQEIRVTASLGAVCIGPDTATMNCKEVIGKADRQLYQAKRAGRNRVAMEQTAMTATS